MGTTNPKILNLDELELEESDITIVHKGTSHKMRVLTVDEFIAQNKRAIEHQKLVAKKVADGEDPEATDVLELIRNSISQFFPTLPVGELPTAKMFTIFGWLNDMSAKLNEAGAEATAAEGDTEGNAQSPEAPAGS